MTLPPEVTAKIEELRGVPHQCSEVARELAEWLMEEVEIEEYQAFILVPVTRRVTRAEYLRRRR